MLACLVVGACKAEDQATEILAIVVGDGLVLDEARVDVVPEVGARQSKTVRWPAASELEVRLEAEALGCNPSATAWGCPPPSYEDYRARLGVSRGGPELQAFGLKGGVEVAVSEKKVVALMPHATAGPVTLILAAADRDGGATDGP
jgi:hypothetical protein